MTKLARGPDAGYRYGVVLALALGTVVFFIAAPDRPVTRAGGLVLTLAMLLVAVVAGRGGAAVRATTAALAAAASVGVAVAVVLEGAPKWVASALGLVLVAGTIGTLAAGTVRLVRSRGVTVQAVSGALAIYLLFGLLFSLTAAVGAHLRSGSFFAQGTDGTQSEHVYWAFTTMTTTGYGDFTPAGSFGRAVAVVAMLLGQIYLVTVIALLVGNLRRREAA